MPRSFDRHPLLSAMAKALTLVGHRLIGRPAGGSPWAALRLSLQAPAWAPPAPGGLQRLNRVKSHDWTAESRSWRIELTCAGPVGRPWSLLLQRISPVPTEPLPIAQAATFDALITMGRQWLAMHGAEVGDAAELLTGDLEIEEVTQGQVVLALAEGGYARRSLAGYTAIQPPQVEAALRPDRRAWPVSTLLERDCSAVRSLLGSKFHQRRRRAVRVGWS